jgi:eukaryotic-like serine/threonine-protein kinase
VTSKRWERVKELFEAASELGPVERTPFLVQTCDGDEELRREVESLLAAHDADSGFMNKPAGNLLIDNRPLLAPGQHFGQFQEISLLGEGGMGQVYLVLDTRLRRKIALKLLPSSHTNDAARVRRFEHEAQAASALNHPNILTIYEIGQTDSFHFIATEFVEGQTLRKHITNNRMTIGEVLDIAAQIASALQAAHEAGIVHRDIKPENIMLRRDGFVKVLDFGLAKLLQEDGEKETERAGRENQANALSLRRRVSYSVSSPGAVMGTVAYMSPEHARGQEVDARTDIWSLGVVLYEMVTGRAPFGGETSSQVIAAILESEPAPVTQKAEAPAELQRIIAKALCKDMAARYQTADDMTRDLKNLKEELTVESRLRQFRRSGTDANESAKRAEFGSTKTIRESPASTVHGLTRQTASVEYFVGEIKRHKTFAGAALLVLLLGAIGLTYFAINRNRPNLGAHAKKSIAVLPLKPIAATNRDEVYEIGIADSLIHRLSSMKGLVVRPLNATRKYTTLEQDPIAAGREQQVDYVLASNYEVAGGKIRVTAQLFNVVDGRIEETYQSGERDSSNVFVMQDAIADEIGKRLLARFNTTSTSTAATHETINKEAYLLYLQGKSLMGQRSPNEVAKALKYFEQAVRLDPNYARAYAGMAHASVSAAISHGDPTRVEIENIRKLINKTFELDNNLAEAYAARADFSLKYEWNFPAVEKDLLRALELEPNNDVAHWLYALLSAYRGNFDKAMEEIETAQSVDPSALLYKRDRGRILYYSHRYDEAIVQFKRVIELNENFSGTKHWLLHAYELKGDYADAYEVFIKLQKQMVVDYPTIKPIDAERVEIYQKAYESGGWHGVRRKQLEFDKIDSQKSGMLFFDVASLCALLGEKDQAFEFLNRAVEHREWAIIMLNVEPTFDSLRDDPRFAELVRRVGLQ